MKKKIAILAGNYTQFIQFVSLPENGSEKTEYFYIDFADKAYGCHFTGYQIIGTFWNREDAGKLEEIVKSRLILPHQEELNKIN